MYLFRDFAYDSYFISRYRKLVTIITYAYCYTRLKRISLMILISHLQSGGSCDGSLHFLHVSREFRRLQCICMQQMFTVFASAVHPQCL